MPESAWDATLEDLRPMLERLRADGYEVDVVLAAREGHDAIDLRIRVPVPRKSPPAGEPEPGASVLPEL